MRRFHQAACRALASARPLVVRITRNLPLLPRLAEFFVQQFAQRFQLLLGLLPDDIDLRVVGDVPQRDVRNALVDEPLSHAAIGTRFGRRAPLNLRLLRLPLRAIGQQVVRIARAHNAGAGQRERHPRGVYGDPATAPLLGDISRCARAASRVENEVAGVGGHEYAAFYHLRVGLNHVSLVVGEIAGARIGPDISMHGQFKNRRDIGRNG